MSSFDESELKAGHPPAVKAGGMRITQHKTPREEREAKPSEDSKAMGSPPKAVLISGAITKGNADFTSDAIKSFHEKPTQRIADRPISTSRPIHIQQPRK